VLPSLSYCLSPAIFSKKQLVLSTSGNSDIQGNIIDVFGTKQVQKEMSGPLSGGINKDGNTSSKNGLNVEKKKKNKEI